MQNNTTQKVQYAALIPPAHSSIERFLPSFLKSYLTAFARYQILTTLSNGIRGGQVKIDHNVIGMPSNDQMLKSSGQTVFVGPTITVLDDNFWLRIFTSYDIGFSEAYMAGEFETPDLKAVLNLYIDNLSNLDSLSSPLYKVLRSCDIFSTYFLSHGPQQSVENVAGYNASNELYKAFLSKEMTYSCPIWGKEEGGVRGDLEGFRRPGDLEAAQARKVALLLTKARLGPGSRLLEIGTGWGSLSIAAAKMGCMVDTITISTEQYEGAKENIKDAGVEDSVRVHLLDYRDLPDEFEDMFDACISVEMLEAVGVRNMKLYLTKIDRALKKERGFVVLVASSYPEASYTPYQGNDFTRKYHWPNTVPPSPTSLLNDFERYTPRRFCVDTIEDIADNYPRCLREWGRRLEENWSPELARALIKRYPDLKDSAKMDMFRRKWRYMFAYMDVAYSRRWLSLTLWVMKRPGQEAAICS